MNLMRKFSPILFLLVFNPLASASTDIATCSGLAGQAFYHGAGVVGKKDQGWQRDGIKNGKTTVKKLRDGKYDILVLDATGSIFSARQDGGEVILLRRGTKDATFLYVHPGLVIEIYTLWTDLDGVNRLDLLSSKGGDGMPIHKSSVMTGVCGSVNFTEVD